MWSQRTAGIHLSAEENLFSLGCIDKLAILEMILA